MIDVSPMGPGFFIFFHEPQNTTRGGGNKGGDGYYAQAKLTWQRNKAKKLNSQKKLKKELIILESKMMLAVQQSKISTIKEIELELAQVSKSLLDIEKDLTEITQARKTIKKRARIMRNNEKAIILLIGEGWL